VDRKRENRSNTGIMPLSHVFLSGIFSGVVSAIALTPADHIKTLLQKEVGKSKYRGSIDAGKDVFRKFGVKGLYLGFNSTFVREVAALSVYFYSYEYIMRLFANEGQTSYHTPLYYALLAGGVAGSNSWLFTYPIDYVKTVMQSQNLEKMKYRSSWHCTVEQYKSEGWKAFFKGLGITMLRSFPVNGVAFLSF